MNVKVSGEAVRGKEMKGSHFLSLHLASVSPFACHSAVTSLNFP